MVERRGVVATEAHRDQIVVLEERGQGPVGALGLAEKPLPVDPFARSLANLESVIGPLFLAITVARLVSMELADRRR